MVVTTRASGSTILGGEEQLDITMSSTRTYTSYTRSACCPLHEADYKATCDRRSHVPILRAATAQVWVLSLSLSGLGSKQCLNSGSARIEPIQHRK